MSTGFEQYCGDVTQSMAFNGSDVNSDSDFHHSSPGKKLTGPIDQKSSKLKCFNCYTAKKQRDARVENPDFCVHCGGTNYVTSTHPLALLLNQVFEKKFSKPQIIRDTRDSILNELKYFEAIKQQAQQVQQKKKLCSFCGDDCEQNYYFKCQSCEDFCICQDCTQTHKGFQKNHHHLVEQGSENKKHNIKLTTSLRQIEGKKINYNDQSSHIDQIVQKEKLNSSEKKTTKDEDQQSQRASAIISRYNEEEALQNKLKGLFYNSSTGTSEPHYSRVLEGVGVENRQSFDFFGGPEPRQSFGYSHQDYTQKQAFCDCCGDSIQDLMCVCQTCKKQGKQFKICGQCHDMQKYNHPIVHKLDFVFTGTLMGRKTDFFTQKEKNDEDDNDLQEIKLAKKTSSVENIPIVEDYSPFGKPSSAKKPYRSVRFHNKKGITKTQKNSVNEQSKKSYYDDQSRINLDCGSLYSSSQIDGELKVIDLDHKKSSEYEVNNSIEALHSNKGLFANFALANSEKIEEKQNQSEQVLYNDLIPTYVESQDESFEQIEQINLNKGLIFQNNVTVSKIIKKGPKIHSHSHIQSQKVGSSCSSEIMEITNSQTQQFFQKKQHFRAFQSWVPQENHSTEEQQKFIFYQYNCDNCGCQPIINVRYHCLDCQDYDLCEQCYTDGIQKRKIKKMHPLDHEFEKIDGKKKLIEQKMKMLQKDVKNTIKNPRLSERLQNMHPPHLKIMNKAKQRITDLKSNVNQIHKSIINQTKNRMTNSVRESSLGISKKRISNTGSALLSRNQALFKNSKLQYY